MLNTVGIIDIGSNSIRLVIAELYDDKAYKIIYEIKKSVRLAKDMNAAGELSRDRMELAIETLSLFRDICDGFNTDKIISVATAAVRVAKNQTKFIELVRQETGIEISILDGVEEAYYDYFGIINSMNFSDGIIIDIGGASTELIWVNKRGLKEAVSLPFGAITLTEKFDLLDEPDTVKQDEVIKYISSEFNNIGWLKNAKGLPLIGVGGTIRNIGKIDRKMKEYPLDVTHNYCIDAPCVTEISNMVKMMNLKQRRKVKGLSKDRADIFVGGISIVETLINHCGCPTLSVSGHGVREGLIYSNILNSREPLENVLDFSLNGLLYINGLRKFNSEVVWGLTRSLFEQMMPIYEEERSTLNILKVASYLYNIGINIDYYNNKEHTFYMMIHSKINGITPREKLMAAYVVRVVKKDGIVYDVTNFESLLLEEERKVIEKLAIILKISVDLNMRKNNNVEKCVVKIIEDTVVIKLISKTNPDMEIDNAMCVAHDFERLYNKKLIII